MPGTWVTPTIIAKMALIVLENNWVMANLVHRDYSSEYKKIGSTVVVRNPASHTSTTVSGTVNLSTVTEGSVVVVLDKHLDITIPISSQELSLQIVDFSQQVVLPVMRAHAQRVDQYLCEEYKGVAGHQLVSATPAVSDIAGVRAVMNVLKAPLTERRLVHHPITEADYVSLQSFLNAEKVGSTRVIKEAHMGRVLGFEHYMDQNIQTHTNGLSSEATAANVGTVVTGGTVGSGTMTLSALGTSETIFVGDIFKFTGEDDWHVISEAETCAGGSATVIFTPVMKNIVDNGAVVTFQDTHRVNLAFHKNWLALVSAPLAPPIGGARAGVMSYKNIAARVVYDYTIMEKQNLMSIDLLIGVKQLDANLAARLVDAR